jgi:hypothetical protein
MKVDASSIHLETPLNPSVSGAHGWRALLLGRLPTRLPTCGRLSIGLLSVTRTMPEGAGWQPARRMPSCPTCGERFLNQASEIMRLG